MSTETLIDSLEKLQKLHEKLYELSVTKTEVIKNNDMEGLQQLLKDEQTYVAAINTMEVKRQEAAKQLLGKETEITIADCITAVPEPEKEQLRTLQTAITSIIDKLKDQNELNQMLIHQSLQFVNMTLSMIQPKHESINYGRPDQKQTKNSGISMFNSKA